MRKIIFFSLIIIISFNILGVSQQTETNNVFDKLLRLSAIPKLEEKDKILLLISDLMNEQNGFKYSKELKDGMFELKELEDGYDLFIYADLNKYKSRNKSNAEVINIRKCINKNNTSDKSLNDISYEIKNISNYFPIKMNFTFNTSNTPTIFNYRQLYLDMKILQGVVPSGQTTILNRERCETFLRNDGIPVRLYSGGPLDGVIVPDYSNGQNHTKIFTVDQAWNRIIYCNYDYQPSNYEYFQSRGWQGNGYGEYLGATGITYGHIDDYGFRELFVSEYGNNRVQCHGYQFNGGDNIWTNKFTLDYPDISGALDISHHKGVSLNNKNDDLIWISNCGKDRRDIVCWNYYGSGFEAISIQKYQYNGSISEVIPSKLDTYAEYPNGIAQRSMLAFVNQRNNSVVLIHLQNGWLPNNTGLPEAFSEIFLPQGEFPTCVKFVSELPNSINPVGILISSNDLNGNGHLHKYKILFSPSSNWTVPVITQYIASSEAPYDNHIISNSIFKNLSNLESQIGYTDLFTYEDWNEQYGMRKMKPGVDITQSQWGVNYCKNTGIDVSINVSNPVRVIPETMLLRNVIGYYQHVNATINGINTNGNAFYLQTGTNYLNIKVDIPNSINTLPSDNKVLIRLYCVPIDEINYLSPNRQVLEFNNYAADCLPPVGGCPFVFVYDGVNMAQDNNILHRSNFADFKGTDITDKYKLSVYPKFNDLDSTCNLQLKELDNDYSYIDKFQLKAIDHPQGTILGITENKDLVLYFPQDVVNPGQAYQNETNVTSNLQYDSTSKPISGDSSDVISTLSDLGKLKLKYEFQKTKSIIINVFSKLLILNPAKKNGKELFDNIVHDSIAVILDGYRLTENGNINKDYAGVINAYNNDAAFSSGPKMFARREGNSTIIVPVSKDIYIDSINTVWSRDYTTSFLCTTPIYYEGFIERSMELLSADNPIQGDIKSLLLEKDDNYANLDNQGEINLYFKKPLDETPAGWMRDYVIIVDGRYEQVGGKMLSNKAGINSNVPKEFKLYQNYPNPFNPVSTIKYDVPKVTRVKIVIYDLVGREIKTLVNEVKEAGSYNIQFNASNFASGVYFYRIQAGDYIMTKRMVLIK